MWLFFACEEGAGAESAVGTESAAIFDSIEVAPGDSSKESADSDVAEPDGCASLYDAEKLPAFQLDFADRDWVAIQGDYRSGQKDYHPATFTFEGEEFPVQVRLKGNPSFSWFGDKLQFVVSFNEDDPDVRFHGLRKLALDATWYEPTMLRDRLAWSILRDHSTVPAACANNATLDINGEFYGIYANIQYFDHEYLERVFPTASTGTLWKYGTEPTANADAADYAKLDQFWRARTLPEMAQFGDPNQWVTAWAAEAVLGDDDGYWCCGHNFYLYDHPDEGLQFMIWDMDDTFEVTPYDSDPIAGYGRGLFQQRAFQAVLGSPDGRAAYVAAVATLTESLRASDATSLVRDWDAQIRPALEADPHRTFTIDEHDAQIERLAAFLPARIASLDAWIACQADPLQDADSDGLSACDDNDESIPVASETCDGGDNDANGLVDDVAACDDCEAHAIGARHLAYCHLPRDFDAAEANCESLGGALAVPRDDEEVYLTFFYTWSLYTPWWLGQDNGSTCLTWDPTTFSYGTEPCTDLRPSVCRLP